MHAIVQSRHPRRKNVGVITERPCDVKQISFLGFRVYGLGLEKGFRV